MQTKIGGKKMDKATATFMAKADALCGRISTVTYATEQKVRKAFQADAPRIIKRSTFQIRVGLEYANQKAVKEAHASGSVARVGLADCYKKLSRSCYLNTKRNVTVLAGSPVDTNQRKTEWFLNGENVPFATVEPMLYAQRKNKSTPKWITLDAHKVERLTGVTE
jgi:hypothetical protein